MVTKTIAEMGDVSNPDSGYFVLFYQVGMKIIKKLIGMPSITYGHDLRLFNSSGFF